MTLLAVHKPHVLYDIHARKKYANRSQ
jgi:hypothetical protein